MTVKQYYDRYAKSYDSTRATKHFFKLNKIQLDFLKDCVGFNKHLLEVGCGTGEFLKHFPKACGVDFSKEMVSVARSKYLNVIVGNATELYFGNAFFDYAYSFKVFAHVPNCEKMLLEMARVSKYGIVFDFYDINSLKAIKDYFRKTTYIRHDSLNSIKCILDGLNLTIEKTKKYKGYHMIYATKKGCGFK